MAFGSHIGIYSSYGSFFRSEWTTTNTGTSSNDQISLPLISSGTYNFLVNWGDGNEDTITTWNDSATTHTYASTGTYDVTISGVIEGFQFNNGGDKSKIINISSWGPLKLTTGSVFYGCNNLNFSATGSPNLSGLTNFFSMFRGMSILDADISSWDTSGITNMNSALRDAVLFDWNLSSWDFSSVTTMSSMFLGVTLSTANYDALLIGLDSQSLNSSVSFHGGSSQYSVGAATTARTSLINDDSWTITDGGQA